MAISRNRVVAAEHEELAGGLGVECCKIIMRRFVLIESLKTGDPPRECKNRRERSPYLTPLIYLVAVAALAGEASLSMFLLSLLLIVAFSSVMHPDTLMTSTRSRRGSGMVPRLSHVFRHGHPRLCQEEGSVVLETHQNPFDAQIT